MFKKVLVAEDMDSISEGLNSTLQSMGITNIHHAKYCDNAFLKIKQFQTKIWNKLIIFQARNIKQIKQNDCGRTHWSNNTKPVSYSVRRSTKQYKVRTSY